MKERKEKKGKKDTSTGTRTYESRKEERERERGRGRRRRQRRGKNKSRKQMDHRQFESRAYKKAVRSKEGKVDPCKGRKKHSFKVACVHPCLAEERRDKAK